MKSKGFIKLIGVVAIALGIAGVACQDEAARIERSYQKNTRALTQRLDKLETQWKQLKRASHHGAEQAAGEASAELSALEKKIEGELKAIKKDVQKLDSKAEAVGDRAQKDIDSALRTLESDIRKLRKSMG